MKKLLTLILSVTLLLGCIYVPASAEEPIEPLNDHFEDELIVDNTSEITDEDYYRYILPIYSSDVVYSQFYNNISYSIDIGSETSYNNLKVSYASTTDITLTNYADRTLLYSDTISVPITFNIEYAPSEDEILTDFHVAEFSEVLLSFAAYKDGEIKETKTISLYVFPTDVGVFISSLGKEEAFNAYVEFLKLKNVIDEATYKSAIQSMTTAGYSCKIDDLNRIDRSGLNSYQTERYGNSRLIKCFDPFTKNISTQSKLSYLTNRYEQNTASQNSIAEMQYEYTLGSVVEIIFNVELVNPEQNQLRVYGYVNWSDITGRIHPMIRAKVFIMDEEILIDEQLRTVYTDTSGYYSAYITNDVSLFEGGYDLFVKVSASTSDFIVKAETGTYKTGYYLNTKVIKNVKTTQVSVDNYYSSAGESVHKAFQIHQAMVAGYYYYNSLNLSDSNYTTVCYPHNNVEKTGSYAVVSDETNYIYRDAFCNWDTVLHELGHQVDGYIGTAPDFGEEHYLGENLIETYGISLGSRGAWSEGWATYFSISSQLYYNDYVTTISDILTVANQSRDFITITSENTYSVSNYVYTYPSSISAHGEGNEFAVTRVLLQLVWESDIGLDYGDIWEVMSDSDATTFSGFMSALYSVIPKYLISPIGRWLELNNVSDAPADNSSIVMSEDDNPQLFLYKADTTDDIDREEITTPETVYGYYFNILFWDEDFNIIYESPGLPRGSTSSYLVMDYSVWVNVLYELGDDEVCYWSLRTRSCVTGEYYYSSFVKIVLDERIQNMSSLNTAYTDTLTAGEEEWFKFTAPYTGSYTFYSLNTLDVKAELFDSEDIEDDDVIKQDDDSGENYNFSITHNINMGDTVYLKVSGYSIYAEGPISIYVKTP